MISKKHAPMTAVSNKKGSFGFVKEVSGNSYSVKWLMGDENKTAWFSPDELDFGDNIAVSMMDCMTHPFSGSKTKYRVIKE